MGGHELVRPASSKPDRDQKPAGWCARRERQASLTGALGDIHPLEDYWRAFSGSDCLSCWLSLQNHCGHQGLVVRIACWSSLGGLDLNSGSCGAAVTFSSPSGRPKCKQSTIDRYYLEGILDGWQDSFNA